MNYDLPGGIQYGSTVAYYGQLKMSESLILFLQGVLYGENDLPKGSVPHLHGVPQEHRGPLHDLHHKYHDVLTGQLLT